MFDYSRAGLALNGLITAVENNDYKKAKKKLSKLLRHKAQHIVDNFIGNLGVYQRMGLSFTDSRSIAAMKAIELIEDIRPDVAELIKLRQEQADKIHNVAKGVNHPQPESVAVTDFSGLCSKTIKEIDNEPLMQAIGTRPQVEKNNDTEEIHQMMNKLQNQMNNMISDFYWERDRESQTVILSKLSSHMLIILEVVGPEEFDSFYNDVDSMGKTAMILAAVMSSNTQLMDAFDGYKGIDFDVEMDKADTYRGYMYDKYEEAKGA